MKKNIFLFLTILTQMTLAGEITNRKNGDTISVEKDNGSYSFYITVDKTPKSSITKTDEELTQSMIGFINSYELLPSLTKAVIKDCAKKARCTVKRIVPLVLAVAADTALLPAHITATASYAAQVSLDFKVILEAENKDVRVSNARFQRIVRLLEYTKDEAEK